MFLLIVSVVLVIVVGISLAVFVRGGTRWGATPDECVMSMPGDSYLNGGPLARVSMTRAVSIKAPPKLVWPWLAQLGRGAGFYSFDCLDNGGKTSAQHIVSWIPVPYLGDASPLGYLRHLESGRRLTWWMDRERFLGAWVRMVVDIYVVSAGEGARLVIRISGDAAGPMSQIALGVFKFIDSIMARRQLLGLKERIERYSVRTTNPDQAETGLRDQYQLYEVIYASGERAGVQGKENAAHWRQTAIEDGVIENS